MSIPKIVQQLILKEDFMSKEIESMIECPFYIKEGKKFISCEGLLDNTSTVQQFETDLFKKSHQYNFCCVNGGKKCPHYRNIALLYDRGERS